ncbi:hypothetical protein MCOR02_007985 [Pyricularia oryzae]|uniref:Secreted protein n=3 Tax=Pyricularia oryzae TaxID=318829 RepID=A0A151V4S8_PYRO7|nr:uncharacterized protein MGG_18141 [Pyricularia oryzae 70-15]KAH9430649.1 hypothetical protein MCOR02_007985 [Pyricularia oryzae]KAI6290740.1 hypothetical protein MCOR34_010349 [Pyricularia oryzae]KAI6455021.1 hypothetical protein MCOR17_008830 [Pyricularia oryzae]KAI6481838.1 hypothetical protein MCOR13_010695 [Pyricularia oryzae]KAI6566691.1 hypothetical protein MCOR04_008741 [Pyricularia oryzae]
MKFFAALVALLPAAALAAPSLVARQSAAHPFVMDSVACGCVNASGQMDNHGDCIYVAGDTRANVGDVSGLCYKRVSWARDMPSVFTAEFCANKWINGVKGATPVCKPVKLCDNYDGGWAPCNL